MEINNIATNFYSKLYDDQNVGKRNKKAYTISEPEMLESEIAEIIKKKTEK